MLYAQPFSFLDLINEKNDEYIYNSSVSARDVAIYENLEDFVCLGNAEQLVKSFVQSIYIYPYNKTVNEISDFLSELSDYQWYCQNKIYDKVCGYIEFDDETDRHGLDIPIKKSDCDFSLSLYFKTPQVITSGNSYCLASINVDSDYFQIFFDGEKIVAYINDSDVLQEVCELDTWKYLIVTFDKNEEKLIINLNGSEGNITPATYPTELKQITICDYQYIISGLTQNSWAGCLKEVRLWDVARTSEDDILHSIWSSQDLLSYYRFNEGFIDNSKQDLYEAYFSDKWLNTYCDITNATVLDYSSNAISTEIYGNFTRQIRYLESTICEKSLLGSFKDYITTPILFSGYIPIDSNMLTKFDELLTEAREFDFSNKSSMTNHVPRKYFENTNDESFFIFICALGNFIDEFKIKIDRNILFDGNIYSKNKTADIETIEKRLKKYGFNTSQQFKNLDIWTKVLNSKYNYFEAKKRIFDDLLNDIAAISKEKGSLNAINDILNIARISTSLYNVVYNTKQKTIQENKIEKYVNTPELITNGENIDIINHPPEITQDFTFAAKFRINSMEEDSLIINFNNNNDLITLKLVDDLFFIELDFQVEGFNYETSIFQLDKNEEYVLYFKFNSGTTLDMGISSVYKDISEKIFEVNNVDCSALTFPISIDNFYANSDFVNLIRLGISNKILSADQIRRDEFDFKCEFNTTKENYVEPADSEYDYNFDLRTISDYNFDMNEICDGDLINCLVEINPAKYFKNQDISEFYNSTNNCIDLNNLEKLNIDYNALFDRLKYLDINIPDQVSKVISKYKSEAPFVVENAWSIRDREVMSFAKSSVEKTNQKFNLVGEVKI